MWIPLFFLWIIVVFLKYRKWSRRKKRCVMPITVTVTEVLERKPQRGIGLLYKPVFAGTVNENPIIIDTAKYTNFIHFSKGEDVELLIDPDNPKEFIYAEKKYNVGKDVDTLLCVGLFLFTILVAVTF